jgi:hypothetical protein
MADSNLYISTCIYMHFIILSQSNPKSPVDFKKAY